VTTETQQKPQKAQKKKSSPLVTAICILVIVCNLVYIFFSQQIHDFVGGRYYQPTSEMESIIENVGFTWRSDYIMRSTKPELEQADIFNDHCVDDEDVNSALGCYSSADNRIYIYDVKGKELDGVKEAVLMHEVLHAIYDRLSDGRKEALNSDLKNYYESHKDVFGDYMDAYSEEQYYTELHSIIGQRVYDNDLSDSLKNHYAKYFKNHDATVEFYKKYTAVLNAEEEKIEKAKDALDAMHGILENKRNTYRSNLDSYNKQVDYHNRQTELGNWSQSRYDYLVSQGKRIDEERDALNAYIDEYNVEVEKYNALLEEERQLFGKLDSRFETTAEKTESDNKT
jgi:hypothetical protein